MLTTVNSLSIGKPPPPNIETNRRTDCIYSTKPACPDFSLIPDNRSLLAIPNYGDVISTFGTIAGLNPFRRSESQTVLSADH
jgi:hypothetical protein